MKKLTIVFILFLGFISHSCKDDSTATNFGIIKGQAFDSKSGGALINVLVKTDPPSSSILTDAGGNFEIRDISPGNYVVIGSKNGYQENRININVQAGLSSNAILVLKDLTADNNPPDIPTNPYPQNKSTISYQNVTFSWICSDPDGDVLTYDLFLDKKILPACLNQDLKIARVLLHNLMIVQHITGKSLHKMSMEAYLKAISGRLQHLLQFRLI